MTQVALATTRKSWNPLYFYTHSALAAPRILVIIKLGLILTIR